MLHQEFRVTLDAEFQTDPVVQFVAEGANLQELINNAKQYGSELAAYTGARGVKKVDLVNGHTVLGFINIPV
jgi:hypothetical protein